MNATVVTPSAEPEGLVTAKSGHFETSIGLIGSNAMTEEKQSSDDRPIRLVDLALELDFHRAAIPFDGL